MLSQFPKRALFVAAALSVTLMCVSVVNADMVIHPVNYSFEDTPVTADPWWVQGAPSGWDVGDAYIDSQNRYPTSVTGATGSQFVEILANAFMSQNLADTIAANTQYQLSVDLTVAPEAISVGYGMTGAQALLLLRGWDSDTTFATLTVSGSTLDATNGHFTTYSTPLSLPDISLVSQQLRVVIGNTPLDGSGNHALVIDNVRIEAIATPEPGTLALAAIGLLGLLAYAWRKRK